MSSVALGLAQVSLAVTVSSKHWCFGEHVTELYSVAASCSVDSFLMLRVTANGSSFCNKTASCFPSSAIIL